MKKKSKIKREMTDEELWNIADEVHSGRIFCDRNIPCPDLLSSIFMPLALMSEEQTKKMLEQEVSFIYEHIDKAGSRAISGYPSFMSMKYLNRLDAERMIEFLNQMIVDRKNPFSDKEKKDK